MTAGSSEAILLTAETVAGMAKPPPSKQRASKKAATRQNLTKHIFITMLLSGYGFIIAQGGGEVKVVGGFLAL
jgi:hypothetical protein